MFLHPLFPLGILEGQPGELFFKINALDAHQPVIVRIPQRTGFFIIQYKGAVIGPARRHQRYIAPVDLAPDFLQ